MILPRGSISDPTSSQTSGGEPAAYTCNLTCGIGVASGIFCGLFLLIGLWAWYWLRRPMRDSPVEREAEASRLYFLTRNRHQTNGTNAKEKSWVRRASMAAKSAVSPLNPALPHAQTHPKTDRDSPEARAHLVKNMAPIDSVEQYRPSTAPLHGSFTSLDDALLPAPLTIRTRQSTPNIRAQRDVFVNRPAGRLQIAPWTDGILFTNDKCYGKRVPQPFNPNQVEPADVSLTRAVAGGSDPGRNTLHKPIPPPTGKRIR